MVLTPAGAEGGGGGGGGGGGKQHSPHIMVSMCHRKLSKHNIGYKTGDNCYITNGGGGASGDSLKVKMMVSGRELALESVKMGSLELTLDTLEHTLFEEGGWSYGTKYC